MWFRFNRQDGTFDKADKSQVSVFNSGITGRQAHGCINRPIDYQDRNGVEWHISEDGSLSYKGADSVSVAVPTAYSLRSHFYMVDHQDNLWLFGDGAPKLKKVFENQTNISIIEGFKPSAAFMRPLAEKALREKDFVDVAYFEPFYLKDFVAGKPHVKGLV